MLFPFGKTKALEAKVDQFLDLIITGTLCMREAIVSYLSADDEDFENRVEISDYVGFSGRFGYYFTPNHELESLFNWGSTEDAIYPAVRIDTFHFQFAYVYNFRPAGVVPYLTAGVGFLDIRDQSLGSETDLTLGAGAGIRFFVNPMFNFRLEYRFNRFEGDGRVFVRGEDFNFNEFSFGIGWRFPSY